MSGQNQRRGFLSRMFTKSESGASTQLDHPNPAPPSSDRRAPAPPAQKVHIPPFGQERLVVGGDHYPAAYRGLAHGAIEVSLVPEPTNPYDSNAIAVYTPSRELAGYLSATTAAEYVHAIARLSKEGFLIASGEVGEIQGEPVIRLLLPAVDQLEAWASLDPSERTWPIAQACTEPQPREFTGKVVHLPVGPRGCRAIGVSHHQLDFRGYAPGPMAVELRTMPGETPRTKVVGILLPNGKQVGTLYEDMWSEYAGVIEQLGREGTVIQDAEIERWEGGLGVELHLLHPEFLIRWAAAGDAERASMPIRDYALRLAGTTDCQDAILKALGRSTTETKVSAEVHAVPVSSGKYKGQPRLDFLHDGEKLGHLLPTRRDQIPDIFARAADGPAAVKVTIQYSSSGSHRVIYETVGR